MAIFTFGMYMISYSAFKKKNEPHIVEFILNDAKDEKKKNVNLVVC